MREGTQLSVLVPFNLPRLAYEYEQARARVRARACRVTCSGHADRSGACPDCGMLLVLATPSNQAGTKQRHE